MSKNRAYLLWTQKEILDELKTQIPSDFGKGLRVAYMPNHINGNIFSDEIEFGYVKKVTDYGVFVVFDADILKKGGKANAKMCNPDNLLRLDHVSYSEY